MGAVSDVTGEVWPETVPCGFVVLLEAKLQQNLSLLPTCFRRASFRDSVAPLEACRDVAVYVSETQSIGRDSCV